MADQLNRPRARRANNCENVIRGYMNGVRHILSLSVCCFLIAGCASVRRDAPAGNDGIKEEMGESHLANDGAQVSSLQARAQFNRTEEQWDRDYRQIADRVISIGTERATLLAVNKPTAEEKKHLLELENELRVANRAFEMQLQKIASEARVSPEIKRNVQDVKTKHEGLQDIKEMQAILSELGSGAVAVYTLIGTDRYYAIVMTAGSVKMEEYPIKAEDLNRKALEFRQVLQDRSRDPLPMAQEMYKILFAPIANDLEGAKAQTLMWCLDGALNDVPMCALHDGQQYLVERYRNVEFSPASLSSFKDPVSAQWKGLGLGASKAQADFPDLPGVAEELQGIIRPDGMPATNAIFPGKLELDEQFTANAMMDGLREKYSLVHIASHFQFNSNSAIDSFFLLGDGEHLTLQQINKGANVFDGVELLTLSACNTGVASGMLAQRQGAEAVMVTLWSVDDESTQEFMREFYHLRQASAGITKAEALRQAQLEMLSGALRLERPAATSRGVRLIMKVQNSSAGDFHFDPDKPFAHPYFWAPFTLIGNWK